MVVSVFQNLTHFLNANPRRSVVYWTPHSLSLPCCCCPWSALCSLCPSCFLSKPLLILLDLAQMFLQAELVIPLSVFPHMVHVFFHTTHFYSSYLSRPISFMSRSAIYCRQCSIKLCAQCLKHGWCSSKNIFVEYINSHLSYESGFSALKKKQLTN